MTNTGLFEKTKYADKKSKEADAEEQIKLAIMESVTQDKGELKPETLKGILENEYNATVTENEFPLTVTINGQAYTVNDDGSVEISGPQAVVDKDSITITDKDGNTIELGEVPANTELKISFNASIEGGTVTIEPPVPHITTEAEMRAKKVEFTITSSLPGETTKQKKYTIELKDVYEVSELSSEQVKTKASTYYGAKVTGYTCEGTGVETWRIFYANESNVYLIADDYISINDAPKGKEGTILYNKASYDCKLSFDNMYKDYLEGSDWIIKNSLAKDWLNKYFNYTTDNGVTYPNRTSTNINICAVAYMMDTSSNVWGIYANSKYADYAIGGPPLEMYCASYKETHPESSISYDVTGIKGYSYSDADKLEKDEENNEIYIKKSSDRATYMWLASPSYYGKEYIIDVRSNVSAIDEHGYDYYSEVPGFRPIVCLNSNVKLTKISDDEFEIAE